MKYIDAELLKAKLDEHYRNYQSKYMETRNPYTQGLIDALDLAEQVIDSLQQGQESVAERFARIVRGNLIGIDKEVQQKFEQLYFEVTGNKMYGGYND